MRIIALYRAMRLARRKKQQSAPKRWTKEHQSAPKGLTKEQLKFIEEHRIHWN